MAKAIVLASLVASAAAFMPVSHRVARVSPSAAVRHWGSPKRRTCDVLRPTHPLTHQIFGRIHVLNCNRVCAFLEFLTPLTTLWIGHCGLESRGRISTV